MDIKKQLKRLEERRTRLVEKRKDEIIDLLFQTDSLAVDDRVLAGALLFIMNKANEKDPLILKFKELARINGIKMPSKRKVGKN